MKIKSGVWYWLAVASGAVGLLYGMGLEGSFQTGSTVSDGGCFAVDVKFCVHADSPS